MSIGEEAPSSSPSSTSTTSSFGLGGNGNGSRILGYGGGVEQTSGLLRQLDDEHAHPGGSVGEFNYGGDHDQLTSTNSAGGAFDLESCILNDEATNNYLQQAFNAMNIAGKAGYMGPEGLDGKCANIRKTSLSSFSGSKSVSRLS